MVICADDCALKSENKAVGRRGLSGSLFLIKVMHLNLHIRLK